MSASEEARVRLPDVQGRFDGGDELSVHRSDFIPLVRDLVGRLATPLGRVLRDGRRALGQVDEVILPQIADDQPQTREWLAALLRADFGLYLYATALRFAG